MRKQPLSRQRPGTGKRLGTGHARQSLDSRISIPGLKFILRPPNRGDTIKISTTRVSIPVLKFILRPPNRGDTIKISSRQSLVPKKRDEISETNRIEHGILSKAAKAVRRKTREIIKIKLFDNNDLIDNKQQNYIMKTQDVTAEEGLQRAYETKDGLYQHYNKLFTAGTKDFPTDHTDDLKLPFDDTLNKTKRGRDADAYYRSHHEIDTVIGHSLGEAVALSLENNIKKKVIIHMV